MTARWMSHVILALAPLTLIACGDDTTDGTGGAGGSGGGPTTTTTTTGPTTTSTGTGPGGGGGEGGGTGGQGGEGGVGGQGGAGGEGGTTGEGGGFGGGQQAGTDACPGDDPAIPIVVDAPAAIYSGSTVDAADDLDTCFSEDPADDGGDWILQFELPAAASLRIELEDGEGLDGNLVVRSDCTDAATEYCFPHDSFGNLKAYNFHTEPGTFSVVVDGVGDTSGPFDVRVTATTPACGDGILNPGEICDDLPGNPNDNCIDAGEEGECTFIPAPEELDTCPGEAIAVPEGETILLAGDGYSTDGFIDDYSGSCEFAEGGVDRVFALTPAVTGMMTITIGADDDGNFICDTAPVGDPRCWDGMLYTRATCDLEASELDCSNDLVNTNMVDVVQGVPVYVFVDGYDALPSSSGDFDMRIELMGL